ncbi:hypothetical protein ACHAQH_009966 [Verticillium albo-atrum]
MVSSTRSRSNAPRLIVQLPTELLDTVLFSLPNRDLKNLRLACKSVQATIPLRFGRVFISPHPRDIEVFEAVAQHDALRQQVTEIIYDDARFMDPFPLTEEEQEVVEREGRFDWEDEAPPPKGVPHWYNYFYNKLVQKMDGWRAEDVQRPYHQARADKVRARLEVRASYKVYHKLPRQQEKVMRTNADAKALLHHLPCFPHLNQATLMPAAHGQDLRPLYETPAIRELPYGFIYPPPRGWPMLDPDHGRNPEAEAWDRDSVKNKWRGFRIATRALAYLFPPRP